MQRTALLLVLLTFAALPCHGLVSTNVPLDHWSYDAVHKLADYGLIDSAMLTIKPISRVEMARHIAHGTEALERMADAPEILGALIERLEEEFEAELILIGVREGWCGNTFIKPVEDPYVRYLYAENPTGLENVRGDRFEAGSNVRLGFGARGRAFDRAAFYVQPEYTDSFETDADIDLIRGYGKVMVGPVEILAGQESLWWGPGRNGSVLMSNNIEPLTMVKITNPQPLQLPWILRGLGPFRGEWFLAELEEDRHIPDAKLSGIRLNVKPHPLLELGASRVVMFGGRGAPKTSLFEYAKTFLALSEQPENNQLAGFDASLLLPLGRNMPVRSIRLYIDAAGEDEAVGLPSKWGELLGFEVHDILRTGRTDFRFEYANTHVSGFGDLFYTHNLYQSGYTYKGRVIGHHMGTNSRDLSMHLCHYLSHDLILDLAYDHQTHDLGAPEEPTTSIYEFGATFLPSPNWRVQAGYRYEETYGLEEGDNHVCQLRVVRRF